MKRSDFDTAMANNDIETLIANTFLARVPELVASGMSIEDAIVAAKEREENLCMMMIGAGNYQQQEAVKELKHQMTKRVYGRLRALPQIEPAPVNPRWVECEAALGHTPTNTEFIIWSAKQ